MGEYLTERYRTGDREKLLFFIERFPFATLIPEGVWCDPSYFPLILDRRNEARVTLLGHLDNNNPFLERLDGTRIRAVFIGPNGYISPHDYASRQFPTWNYAVAEVTGISTLVDQESQKMACMVRMVDRLEAANGSDYRLDESDASVKSLMSALTFFIIDVESMTGAFKFSQDKSATDRTLARESLLRKLRNNQDRALPRLTDASGTDYKPAQ